MTEKPNDQAPRNLKDLDINYGHRQFGHLSEQALQATMIHHGFNPIGQLKFCKPWAIAKAKSKPVPKVTHNIASKPAERMFIDISRPYLATIKGSQYYIGIVNDFSWASWSYFIHSKKLIGDVFKNHLRKMNNLGKKIEFLHCDNAGKNTAYLQPVAEEAGIHMEYTTLHMPQQNGVVEQKFPTLGGKQMQRYMQCRTWWNMNKNPVGRSSEYGRRSHKLEFFYQKPNTFNGKVLGETSWIA